MGDEASQWLDNYKKRVETKVTLHERLSSAILFLDDYLNLNKDTLNDVNDAIDSYKKTIKIDARKIFYEEQATDTVKTVEQILFVVYYGLILIYFMFGSFFSKAYYKNWKFWLILSLYIVFPYLLIKNAFRYPFTFMYSYVSSDTTSDSNSRESFK